MGEHESLPFVVMQFLPGGDLKERLTDLQSKGGQMSPASMKGWLREICGALDFVSDQGMIHRDVKPANILFDEHNNAFLSDFGLTKIVLGDHRDDESEMTGAGFVVGTPNYVAPEIILGNEYDGRADQYSLGILIYHLMSGEPPMQGASSSATMVNQTQRKLPPLSDVRPDFPRKAAIAVHKAIQKQPADRFSTSLEFAHAVIDGLAPVRRRTTPSAASTASSASVASSQSALPPRQKRRRKKQGSSSQQLSDSSLLSQGESLPQKISKGKKGLVNCPKCDVPLPLRPMHAGRTGHCIHCHARLKIGKDLARLWLLSSSGGNRRKTSENRDLVIGEEVFGLTLPKKIVLALAALLLMVTIGATIYMTMFFTGETEADRLKEKVNTNKSIEGG